MFIGKVGTDIGVGVGVGVVDSQLLLIQIWYSEADDRVALAEGVSNASSPSQNCCNRSEIIIQDNDIRALFRDFSTLDTHRKPNISFFKGSSRTAQERIAFSVGLPENSISEPEVARVNVTANGSPSGIATTTMVTAAATIPTTALMISSTLVLLPLNSVLPFSSSVLPVKYRINKTRRTRKATAKPTFPIDEVSLLSRACRGVCSSVSRLIVLIISPHIVFIPTEVTSILA
ncbi:hypothetical protein RJ640_011481 [Escallonia rubra]|uniref:Uncharacterized protein n=1 Tax=Escallonia rubra TaxID=112253 RepID=A0AA88R1M3_9ASTE|nr:hypothetical protein RJ640_011481 [Escallonia rubra]